MTDPSVNPPRTAKELRAQARLEKAQRKMARPFWKKKRFIIPVLFIILIVAISAGVASNKKKTEKAAAKTCVGKTYPDQQSEDFCADATNTVTLNGVSVTAEPLVAKKDEIGGKALCSQVTIVNNTSESQDYNVLDFKVQTPSGDVTTLSTLTIASTLNSGTIIKGATKKGLVCTDDKGEKGQYVFIYKPGFFDDRRGIWLFTV